MNYALILASGTSSRFNSSIPKQFCMLGSMMVVEYSIKTFLSSDKVDKVVLVMPEGFEDIRKELSSKYEAIDITYGSSTRDASLEKGMDVLRTYHLNDEDIVLTHDGARPFVTGSMIEESIEKLERFDCVTVAFPSTDTLLYTPDGEGIEDIPDRSKYYRVQTPQSFRLGIYEKIRNELTNDEIEKLTDVCSMFVSRHYNVGIVMGSSTNIKITYPEDLLLAKVLSDQKIK